MSDLKRQLAKMDEQDFCEQNFDFDSSPTSTQKPSGAHSKSYSQRNFPRKKDLKDLRPLASRPASEKEPEKTETRRCVQVSDRQETSKPDNIAVQLNAVRKQMNREAELARKAEAEKKKQAETHAPLQIPDKREDDNGIYFNPELIPKIRKALKEQGVETHPLCQGNSLPNIHLLHNPTRSYSKLFGEPCGFLVTGYRNNGRTERIIVSPVDAPSCEDNGVRLDVFAVIGQVRQRLRGRSENFSFSLILSADEKNQGDDSAETVILQNPFSIDGIFGGIYKVDGKPTLFVRNTLPSRIRNSYPYFEELKNGTYQEDSVEGFFRRITRGMENPRDRAVLLKELKAFALTLPLTEAEKLLGDINKYIEH